jgi:hypothetical protein
MSVAGFIIIETGLPDTAGWQSQPGFQGKKMEVRLWGYGIT